MKKTQLSKAIKLAIAGTALGIAGVSSAQAADVYYNQYNVGAPVGNLKTDGWVYGTATCIAAGNCTDATNATASAQSNFTGLAAGVLPFSYSGKSIVNWATQIGGGESIEISSADAQLRSGIAGIDIDAGKGAWQDRGSLLGSIDQGWAHNTDIGLFRLDVATDVTFTPALTAAGASPSARFGITIFSGFDTGTGYTHHTDWNVASGAPASYEADNPFGTTGVEYFDHNDNVTSLTPWTVNLPAGDYSIYLGGNGGIIWSAQFEGYKLGIDTAAPVPVPGAAWLFGGAIASLIGANRRKRVVPA